jgi:hypothetical protein
MRYPGDYDRYDQGTTDLNGSVTITVRAIGTFDIEIMPDIIHGYSESLFYQIEAKGALTTKLIDRGTPELYVSLDPNQSPVYGANGTLLRYQVKYVCGATKRYNLTTEGLGNTITYYFDKTYVEHNNDTVNLFVSIPPFFDSQMTPKKVTFVVKGSGAGFIIQSPQQTITQTWYFNLFSTSPAVFNSYSNGGDYYLQIAVPQIQIIYSGFDIASFTVKIKDVYWGDNSGGGAHCVSYWSLPDDPGFSPQTNGQNYYYGSTQTANSFDNSIGKLINYTYGQTIDKFIMRGTYNMTAKIFNIRGAKCTLQLTNGIWTFEKQFQLCGDVGYTCACPQ